MLAGSSTAAAAKPFALDGIDLALNGCPHPLVQGVVQLHWKLRDCTRDAACEDEGPLSEVARQVYNLDIKEPGGRFSIGVFFYDKWAQKCAHALVKPKDKLCLSGNIHVYKNERAEAGDHAFCLVVAEDTLVVAQQRRTGLRSPPANRVCKFGPQNISVKIMVSSKASNSSQLVFSKRVAFDSGALDATNQQTAAPAAGTGNSRTSNQRAAPHDATQPSAKRKRDEYTYTRLADLQLGDANVWGTVSQFSQPKQTSGPDVMVTVTIVDESQQNGLQINVFASSEALLPQFKV
jgi:hypothetical protein